MNLAPQMASRIELWPVEKLIPYARNARTHSDAQVAQIAASIMAFGFNNPILVDTNAGIIAGHGRLLAARKLRMEHVPVVVLDHLTETQRRAYVLADNKLAEQAGWDDEMLRGELADLKDADLDLEALGFSEDELRTLLAETEPAPTGTPEVEEEIPEAPVEPVTRTGDVWLIGKHRLVCGDCRDFRAIERKFEGVKANVVITSPPYATQREYDPASGFKPVPPEEYSDWFRDVAANIAAILAADGSYFLNIKEHAADGERDLYVKDLVIAHRRQWGWRFVDEFCWRKTDNGVPGGWGNRFKNAWEPVFHFCRQPEIKFRPQAVGHVSEDCFDYSPNNPKSTSGSGLLGTGARGSAAGQPGAADEDGRFTGIARPSNVVEVKSESSQGSHSAPFPRTLVEFFVKAFSDAGDIVFDPFLGSGTTMAAAHVLGRVGYGIEISPAYCDVILRRMANLAGEEPVLAESGEQMGAVAASRGVPIEQVDNPRLRDARRIQHHGPAPFYGSRKAS
ncbi:MAG TPA: DNA methyltransferase [Gemmataceae bacterium]|nr:DNA methyltransferase [Bryobacteraceae bacterium]HZV06121.1 DNA methyltransferase [Gemmataceae bacterium]